ncbi:SAM-dependent methyltransferase [Roseomonas sp. E05]|uniref:SAM-dependent methyltransferase n=1 Tax=Roseomonas sp. E05 TaxID=3046310 RepID=UPI0024B92556|nr:SAM-dependent methyltransferase [Roseomonas sp. E05]MDJ0387984.1 SAM-dependent methyltransferase [Roseomonas sp. E05]
MIRSAYLADEGFEPEVEEELRRAGVAVAQWHGRLALSEAPPVPCAWALDIWTDPREIEVPSIKAAAGSLRAIQRNWSLEAMAHHRRAALIEAALPPLKARALRFPEPAPTGHLGGWTLLAPDRMLASPTKSSPFLHGAVRFEEDREGPPSRAYLKLWEALTRIGRWPGPGEVALDLGAAPGGWSWALAQLGCQVVAVDKAAMDPAVAALPNVAIRTESAFGLEPEKQPAVDWLFSDIICYPARLLALVRRWREAGRARNFVCTLKFQGETDHETAAAFAAIPGARLFHGAHNKHELMFCLLEDADRVAG